MDQNSSIAGEVLILDSDETTLRQACDTLHFEVPGLAVRTVTTPDEFRNLCTQKDFDLVIIDCDLSNGASANLIHEMRLKDNEPAVLALSASEDPRVVANIFNMGCQRYIVKNGEWLSELGPAIRHTLRVKKLEDENRRLISRLTEAHMVLEERNRRLDEFSATVAHDIRGVLGGLSMRLEYILDSSQGTLPPKIQSMLEKAFGTSCRVTEIVQATYDFAHLGAEAINKDRVELTKLVEEVVADLAFDSGLDISIGIDDLPTVWGNDRLLRRVFINLITNAVKYSDKRSKVINIGVRQFVNQALGTFAQIFVEDNGPGIPECNLNDIFKMFYQQKPSSIDHGLGIGLSVVRRVVELHYGTIRAESEVGRGTTFIFTLPTDPIEIGG